MSLKCRRLPSPLNLPSSSRRIAALAISICGLFALASCGSDIGGPDTTTTLKLSNIVIDGGSRAIERGSSTTLTATARDTGGKVVSVPFAWRSTADSIARVDLNGKVVAGDTGQVIVTACALGVCSSGVTIAVVWQGVAKLAAFQFNPPQAVTPGSEPADSIRVAVTTNANNVAVGARVAFAVTAGGGTVSPALDTVRTSGIVSAKWTLGPTPGTNTVTATVVDANGAPISWVKGSPVTFTVKTYAALAVVEGDAQTGNVLAALPVAPSIRLVDSAGKPRPGIPVTFAPTGNGRVANTVVSTTVDGIASPGVWTLGDLAGDQQLVVTVEKAKITLHATATGTATRFAAVQVATSSTATCAVTVDRLVSCMGRPPMIGTGDTASKSSPTLTKGGVHLTSLAGGSSHFCGTTSELSIFCWGVNALVDTAKGFTAAAFEPTRLQSNIAWLQVTPGGEHNCALANDFTAYCWGSDAAGQLGDDSLTTRLVPKPVAGGFKFTALTAGLSHECGLIADGSAFCWGLNSSGQIGDATTTNRRTPTAVRGDLRWKTLGAGGGWTCGLTQKGTAACWGAGTSFSIPTEYSQTQVFSSISVGSAHACALTNDGTAYCWGDNSQGQLGDSTTTARTAPTAVQTELRFTSLSAGVQHTCGITTEGLLACWGRNQFGELGVSTPLVQLTPRYVVLGVTP